jgi:hypothetical protein
VSLLILAKRIKYDTEAELERRLMRRLTEQERAIILATASVAVATMREVKVT